jgi:hypothetical protein
MDEPNLGVYHARALQLADAMKLCRGDLSSYAAGQPFLGPQRDLLQRRCSREAMRAPYGGQDHRQAIMAVAKACSKARIEPRSVEHLGKLLAAKTKVSYGEKYEDHQRMEALCVTAERFQTWAERVLQ